MKFEKRNKALFQMMLVHEDKLQQVLRTLEINSGRYKKKTNDTKVFVTPLCPKLKNIDRPTLTLGNKPLQYKSEEKMLGCVLSQSIQGGGEYIGRVKARTSIAEAKIEKIGSHSGPIVRPLQTRKYYD